MSIPPSTMTFWCDCRANVSAMFIHRCRISSLTWGNELLNFLWADVYNPLAFPPTLNSVRLHIAPLTDRRKKQRKTSPSVYHRQVNEWTRDRHPLVAQRRWIEFFCFISPCTAQMRIDGSRQQPATLPYPFIRYASRIVDIYIDKSTGQQLRTS